MKSEIATAAAVCYNMVMEKMTVKSFGNTGGKTILIQAVDKNSLHTLDEEVRLLQNLTGDDFCLTGIIVNDWFSDLSPWKAPAVSGNNAFGDMAAQTLDLILDLCSDTNRDYYLGGYSLSGLFTLWAAYQTDIFKGIAAVSPSIWFPGFTDYMDGHDILCGSVYLSLGDREGKTKNKVLATADKNMIRAYDILTLRGVNCTLEWNRGNHFTDVEKRCARGFAYVGFGVR